MSTKEGLHLTSERPAATAEVEVQNVSPVLSDASGHITSAPVVEAVASLTDAQQAVQDALKDIQKADTLDVVRRRINGTSALGTRSATMVGLPVMGTALLSGPLEMGARFIAGGTATFLAGAAASAAVYIGQRRLEGKRLKKREASQQVIQDHLDEPIDLIRQKGRRNKETTVRWYGADAYCDGHTDPTVPNRFAKIVDFAEEQKLQHVVVSSHLLGNGAELAEAYKDKLVDTEQLMKKTKGVVIDDRIADESLLKLTTGEARDLVDKLEAEGKILRVEALADWLLACDPEHSVAIAYKNWTEHGKSDQLKPALIQSMRTCVERRAQDDAYGNSRRMFIETDEKRVAVKERLATTVTALPDGIRTLSQGIEPESSDSLTMGYQGFSELVGMNMETFVAAMTKVSQYNLRELAQAKDEQSKLMIIGLGTQTKAKLELALFYALSKPDVLIKGLRSGTARPDDSSADISTLYGRLADERPRSILGLGLRERGTVPKDEQTITYDRLSFRNLGKKLGAAVLAGTIAMGAGWGWSEAWGSADWWSAVCNPDFKFGPKERKECDDTYHSWFPIVEKPADAVSDSNSNLESTLLIQAYKLGIIDSDNIKSISRHIPEKWAREKREDIQKRFNLYGGNHSQMGDVYHDGNPAVWSLESINGAETSGFWASNIQDHITVDAKDSYFKETALPPLATGEVNLSVLQMRDHIVPIGTEVPEYYQDQIIPVRELRIPTVPLASSSVVRVSGRLLYGDLDYYGLGSSKRLETFSLPVIEGGDIVAAKVVVKDLATDNVISRPDNFIYQEENGTFRFGISSEAKKDGYLDIEYWVDPAATTDLAVRAVHPMTSQQRGETYRPLTTVISEQQTKELRRRLNISVDDPAIEVARAIAHSRDYSFTPYEKSRKENPRNLNPLSGAETGAMLTAVAEYAEELDDANCNVATNIQIVATRGKDGKDGFVNGVTGFNNPAGKDSNVLSQTESHQKMVNNVGEFIDSTPGGGQIQEPAAEEYHLSEASQSNNIPSPLSIAEGVTVLGLSAYAGAKFFPMELAYRRRRRLEKAHNWIAQTEELDNSGLHTDLNLLNHIFHSVEPLDEDRLPLHISHGSNYSAEERIKMLPYMTAKDFKLYTETMAHNGLLRLTQDTYTRLRRIIAAAHIINDSREQP